jgi:hypothetical protein
MIIRSDGTEIVTKGKRFTEQEIEDLIGGYFEVPTAPTLGVKVLVAVDGDDRGLPLNRKLSLFCRRTILGDGVILFGEEVECL